MTSPDASPSAAAVQRRQISSAQPTFDSNRTTSVERRRKSAPKNQTVTRAPKNDCSSHTHVPNIHPSVPPGYSVRLNISPVIHAPAPGPPAPESGTQTRSEWLCAATRRIINIGIQLTLQLRAIDPAQERGKPSSAHTGSARADECPMVQRSDQPLW